MSTRALPLIALLLPLLPLTAPAADPPRWQASVGDRWRVRRVTKLRVVLNDGFRLRTVAIPDGAATDEQQLPGSPLGFVDDALVTISRGREKTVTVLDYQLQPRWTIDGTNAARVLGDYLYVARRDQMTRHDLGDKPDPRGKKVGYFPIGMIGHASKSAIVGDRLVYLEGEEMLQCYDFTRGRGVWRKIVNGKKWVERRRKQRESDGAFYHVNIPFVHHDTIRRTIVGEGAIAIRCEQPLVNPRMPYKGEGERPIAEYVWVIDTDKARDRRVPLTTDKQDDPAKDWQLGWITGPDEQVGLLMSRPAIGGRAHRYQLYTDTGKRLLETDHVAVDRVRFGAPKSRQLLLETGDPDAPTTLVVKHGKHRQPIEPLWKTDQRLLTWGDEAYIAYKGDHQTEWTLTRLDDRGEAGTQLTLPAGKLSLERFGPWLTARYANKPVLYVIDGEKLTIASEVELLGAVSEIREIPETRALLLTVTSVGYARVDLPEPAQDSE